MSTTDETERLGKVKPLILRKPV